MFESKPQLPHCLLHPEVARKTVCLHTYLRNLKESCSKRSPCSFQGSHTQIPLSTVIHFTPPSTMPVFSIRDDKVKEVFLPLGVAKGQEPGYSGSDLRAHWNCRCPGLAVSILWDSVWPSGWPQLIPTPCLSSPGRLEVLCYQPQQDWSRGDVAVLWISRLFSILQASGRSADCSGHDSPPPPWVCMCARGLHGAWTMSWRWRFSAWASC